MMAMAGLIPRLGGVLRPADACSC